MRVEWIKFLDETKFDDVHYFGSDDITDDVWKLFRKTRPITAHMLEEMFGITKAQEYAIDLDESFTEKKAVARPITPWMDYYIQFERPN